VIAAQFSQYNATHCHSSAIRRFGYASLMTELQLGMLLILGDDMHCFVRCCSSASGRDNYIKTMHHKLGDIQPIVHTMTQENSHGLGCGGKSHCQMSKSMRLKYRSDTNVSLALTVT
jgi:hypothetical protein